MALSDQSRVWLYVSNREFTAEEVPELNRLIAGFCRQWAAHGVNLEAAGEVLYRRLIVLMVDESKAGASGCSIDASVHFVQELERQFNVRLFDRMIVAVMKEQNPEVISVAEAKERIVRGELHPDTPVINTLAATKKALDDELVVPLSKSWLSRFLQPATR